MITAAELSRGFHSLGVRPGDVLMVHSSLSSLGTVDQGATGVLRALLECVDFGTIVAPTFTTDIITDPFPEATGVADPRSRAARDAVPLFTDTTPTRMGAIPSAVLAHPRRLRSSHPQASVAAIGSAAREVTNHQPLKYALGAGSPFARLYAMNAKILLIGVGHNRNSFLHHAESYVAHHRRKLRRFPYVIDGERVWVEVPDVGDDNDTYFPLLGDEFGRSGGISSGYVGAAMCQLLPSVAFIDFATARLGKLLRADAST